MLANRLSANGRYRVLLIEAGGAGRHPSFHIPVGYVWNRAHPRGNWLYETEPEPGTGNRRIPRPRGKVLGGWIGPSTACSKSGGIPPTRRVARPWQRRLGLERSLPLLPAGGGSGARSKRVSRHGRPACRERSIGTPFPVRRHHRGGEAVGATRK